LISAIVVANIAAPPMPWMPRAVISSGASGGEDHEAGEEDPPPAVEVGERSGAEHQRGQGQRVDVDHPLELAVRRRQVLRHVG
jgi:hypothetical protein